MKKGLFVFMALCLPAFASSAWAGNGGDALFKKICGACHQRGGEAAPINPGEKAGIVWDKYFKRGRHPVELNVSESDMDIILQYLQDHAADSDQPEMSAIPK